MKTAYPAKITPQPEGGFLVEFPDLPGCLTEGATLEEAKVAAREALSGYLASFFDRDVTPLAPKRHRDTIQIEPDPQVAFALWLRQTRQKSGMSLTEVADRLGVRYQVYQKLENPKTSNPTLKRIKELEDVFQAQLLTV